MWKYVTNAIAGLLIVISASFLSFTLLGLLGVLVFFLSVLSLADNTNFPRIMNLLFGFFVVWAAAASFHSGWLFVIFGIFIFLFSILMAITSLP